MKQVLFAAILVLAGCGAPPKATPVARFSIVSDSQGGVWRLDTQTGELRHCTLGGDLSVHCWLAPQTNSN